MCIGKAEKQDFVKSVCMQPSVFWLPYCKVILSLNCKTEKTSSCVYFKTLLGLRSGGGRER